MKHTEVYSRFSKLIPIYAKRVVQWWPNGLRSIRIRLNTDEEFIFSMDEDAGFRFETMDSFLIRLKGGSTMKC